MRMALILKLLNDNSTKNVIDYFEQNLKGVKINRLASGKEFDINDIRNITNEVLADTVTAQGYKVISVE